VEIYPQTGAQRTTAGPFGSRHSAFLTQWENGVPGLLPAAKSPGTANQSTLNSAVYEAEITTDTRKLKIHYEIFGARREVLKIRDTTGFHRAV
jgi:hypothetical protein